MTKVNKKGIDVSKHQGVINWDKVKAAGIEFAMLRAGFGNNNIDGQFKRNIKECNRVGIPVGVYWFSYALNAEMAAREAWQCIEAIKPYKVEYPVCFDLEYDTVRYAKEKGVKIDKTKATTFVKAFCTEVEKSGYFAMNYSNQDYARSMFDMDYLSRFDLWYAYYNKNCSRNDAGLWQYTSSGKVTGINGNVDLDIAFKDYPAIIRGAGLNGLSKTASSSNSSQDKAKAIVKGGKVKVLKAIQYNGQPFKTYYKEYDVISVNGDKVVIGIGKTVTAAVKASNLAGL
ncbi:GH25 family lysozyme M1 (1,4-beta-N-acetylmuramidase) [Ruminiclostridium sufflavum DSM 19573]|uniref:GH25 family lysozyme M1 (1,4-beta-N-acetylmuramidase) n=1 Tax=Ruminiclostridium sufflavum DSM 19573 TaxID=1121337 RepID=A0A318XM26_9FIRM|nr:glycoside hydrolase family 25 protein [Ruminiclostridium sufflavum]PYG86719.1 GH25 family lysozyme M1 (1,4-beta-N-acetylmuramidase) [Ruminiclostridium sufflavum DSM 19573]